MDSPATLAQAAADQDFNDPTPIQAQAIPAVLRSADLLATVQTGSGKTAAYALPLLQRLAATAPTRAVPALVLVPTRELAAQVGEVLRSLAQALPRRWRIAVAVGGVSINPQLMALRGGADVVVTTPGRLLGPVAHNALRPSGVQCLVLDEADRLFDLGFADELAKVLAQLPAQRQSLFFSATFPPAVQALALQMLRDPVRVDVPATAEPEAVVLQRAIAVDARRRAQLLRQLTRDNHWERVLVFVATQHMAEHLATKLQQGDVYATTLHGGLALSFITAEQQAHWHLIQKRQGLSLPVEVVPGFEPVDVPPEATGTGGIKGKRPSKKDKLRTATAAQAAKPVAD